MEANHGRILRKACKVKKKRKKKQVCLHCSLETKVQSVFLLIVLNGGTEWLALIFDMNLINVTEY